MNTNSLRAFAAALAVMAFTVVSARAAEPMHVSQVSGEITWVDVNQGRLQLKRDGTANTAEVNEYRITKDETRVTNPSDKKFLTVDDLQPGQRVVVDVIDGEEDRIVQKITTEPVVVSEVQIALGDLQSIDLSTGVLVLEERPAIGTEGTVHVSQFAFEPRSFVVLQSPDMQPSQAALNPGDVLKLQYTVVNGQRRLRSVTRYAPKPAGTTTTTTVTTTQAP